MRTDCGFGVYAAKRWRFACLLLVLPFCVAKAEEVATAEPHSQITPIRPEANGLNGAVVSGHHLASQAGLNILQRGGNAVDAAVAMAAILAIVRPHMNGVGGDAFALIYDSKTQTVHALNASGRAGAKATPEFIRSQGFQRVPFTGPLSVTVPGAVSAWDAALKRFGSRTFEEVLAPAIAIAESGFVVSESLASDLEQAAAKLNRTGQALFLPAEQPLQPGSTLRNEGLARTLRTLAEKGAEEFYHGEIGEHLGRFIQNLGGHLGPEDFKNHTVEWTQPLTLSWKGLQVHTLPPNSQGITLLQILGLMEGEQESASPPSREALTHKLIEANRIAFADRDQHLADPDYMRLEPSELLEPDYLATRRGLFTANAGGTRDGGMAGKSPSPKMMGDTVYLSAVDKDGNAVSWIQSLYGSFGSGLVEPETGIVLHNRGAGFSLEADHPNEIKPGKRPFHTLMATLITEPEGALGEKRFSMTLGTPGGSGQPQFISQALMEMKVFNKSPQNAVEAPRFRMGRGKALQVESRFSASVLEALGRRGHELSVEDDWTANFGSVAIIQRQPDGAIRTGADMRREATALAW